MKKTQKVFTNILGIVDLLGYIQAFIQIIIYKNYAFGTIVTFICAIMSLFLYVIKKQDKVYGFFQNNFKVFHKPGNTYLFLKVICIFYIVICTLIYLITFIFDSLIFGVINLILMPLLFSLLMIVSMLINRKETKQFLKIYYIVISIPCFELLLSALLAYTTNIFDMILYIIGSVFLSLPTYFFAFVILSIFDEKTH